MKISTTIKKFLIGLAVAFVAGIVSGVLMYEYAADLVETKLEEAKK